MQSLPNKIPLPAIAPIRSAERMIVGQITQFGNDVAQKSKSAPAVEITVAAIDTKTAEVVARCHGIGGLPAGGAGLLELGGSMDMTSRGFRTPSSERPRSWL